MGTGYKFIGDFKKLPSLGFICSHIGDYWFKPNNNIKFNCLVINSDRTVEYFDENIYDAIKEYFSK